MQTKWYDVNVYYSDGELSRTFRLQARNKGDAIGQARKLILGYKLSFKAFDVSKGHTDGS